MVISKDSFKITSNLPQTCDIIEENIKLYKNIFFPPKFEINPTTSQTDVLLNELNIEIGDRICPGYPNSTMDESCK